MKFLVFFLFILVAIMAQIVSTSAFYKYLNISNDKHYTGEMIARSLIDKLNLNEVDVKCNENLISGSFYNRKMKTIWLNKSVYYENSIYAIGIAAYQVSLASFSEIDSIDLSLRYFITSFLQNFIFVGWIFLIFGVLFQIPSVYNFGIYLLIAMGICSFIMYPLELKCAKKANTIITEYNYCEGFELEEFYNMTRALSIACLGSLVAFIFMVFRLFFTFKNKDDEI